MKTFTVLILLLLEVSNAQKRPNIVFILADDLGYNDVGYRGNNQVKTPNIDALAYNGAILEKFYTLTCCTPSRAAFLTGNYPIRFGYQGFAMHAGEERHIPSSIPTFPQQMKKLGYKSYLVGKWHLGYAFRNDTPLEKGFDSHYGYYNGLISYFSHEYGTAETMIGHDLRDEWNVDRTVQGTYVTDLLTDKSIEIINNHNYNIPMFLMVSHLAAHTGLMTDSGAFLEEKDAEMMNKTFGYINDLNRRKYVDVLKSLDDSIGKIVKALANKNLLDDTIILFLSDNGGPSNSDLHPNYSSNWPLKGIKFAHFEGGVRGTGVFYSKNMTYRGEVNKNLMHFVDLLPTFYAAGGGDPKDLGPIDGINQLNYLLTNEKSPRTELLIDIDEIESSSSIITHNGRYKLIKGVQFNGSYDQYAGVSGRLPEDGLYDFESVLNSDVNSAFKNHGLSMSEIFVSRLKSSTKNCRKPKNYGWSCELCLFDLDLDPCETTNLAPYKKYLVDDMLGKLDEFGKVLVPQQRRGIDPRANPIYFDGEWTFWLDPNPM